VRKIFRVAYVVMKVTLPSGTLHEFEKRNLRRWGTDESCCLRKSVFIDFKLRNP